MSQWFYYYSKILNKGFNCELKNGKRSSFKKLMRESNTNKLSIYILCISLVEFFVNESPNLILFLVNF